MGKTRKNLVCSMCKQACRHPAALVKHIDDVHINMGKTHGTIIKESTFNSPSKKTEVDFKPLERKSNQESEMDLKRSRRLMCAQSFEPKDDKVLEISYSHHILNVSQDEKEKSRPMTEEREKNCCPCDAFSSDLDNRKKLKSGEMFSPDSYDENDNDCSVGIKRKREPSKDDENQPKKGNVVHDSTHKNLNSNIDPVETAKDFTAEIQPKISNEVPKSVSVDTARFYAKKSSGANDRGKQGVPPYKKVVMEVLSNDTCDKDGNKSCPVMKNKARSCPDKRASQTETSAPSKSADIAKSPKQLAQTATREAFLRSLKSASKEEARQQFKSMPQRRSLPSPLPVFARSIPPTRPSLKLNNKSSPSGRVIETSPVRPSASRKSLPAITPPRDSKPQKSPKGDQSSPKKSNCKSSVKKSLLYKAILNSFLKSQPNSPGPSSGSASLFKTTFTGSRKCLKFDEEEKNLPCKEVNRRHSDPVLDKSRLP